MLHLQQLLYYYDYDCDYDDYDDDYDY